MTDVFLKILNMSLSASWVLLAVLLLRLLFRKAPKWISVALWGIVGIRLISPFSIESVLSLIPSAEVVSPEIMMDWTPEIDTGIPAVNQVVNPIITGSFAPDPATSANPLQLWIPTWALFWAVGTVAMLLYTAISFLRLRRRVGAAVLYEGNVYQSENVSSPFVLGIGKPKIYLPFRMREKDMGYVIAHERAHIRRKDHLWKPLGFLLLAIHWFNPLMWLGYILLCRDIELACDEKVIGELDRDARADYSSALLACSVSRRQIAACPLAFGEVGVKTRVKSVLHYKKPAFRIVAVAMIVCVAVAVCFLTNPPTDGKSGSNVGGADENKGWIGSFLPPDSDTPKLSFTYVRDFGCDVKDVSIDFKGAFLENGEIVFYILWKNEGMDNVNIGPDFTVYKYDQKQAFKQLALDHKGVWIYVREFLPGKGMTVDGGIDGVNLDYEQLKSYNLTEHYGVMAPGKYRFEAHGAWVEFQITDEFDEIPLYYDSAIFDVDGDGEKENCSLRHGITSGLFTFVFLAQDLDTGEIKYETTFYSDVYTLSFKKGIDGVTRVLAVTRDEEKEKHVFDIGIVDGNVWLTENGVPIGEIKSQK